MSLNGNDSDSHTAGELSDTDSVHTAFEFWDMQNLKFYIKSDEDGIVQPIVNGYSPKVFYFALQNGVLIAEFYPEDSRIKIYGKSNTPEKEWALISQVLVVGKADLSKPWQVIDADNFAFGTKFDPIQIQIQSYDVKMIMLDMRYIYTSCRLSSELEDLDDRLSSEPVASSKELLERFIWAQRYNLPNLRRASLLRVESSAKHFVQEMKEHREFSELSDDLKSDIDGRFEHGWTNRFNRLCYWEPTRNLIRKIADGLEGGAVHPSEESLATTFGIQSLDIFGSEHTFQFTVGDGDCTV